MIQQNLNHENSLFCISKLLVFWIDIILGDITKSESWKFLILYQYNGFFSGMNHSSWYNKIWFMNILYSVSIRCFLSGMNRSLWYNKIWFMKILYTVSIKCFFWNENLNHGNSLFCISKMLIFWIDIILGDIAKSESWKFFILYL